MKSDGERLAESCRALILEWSKSSRSMANTMERHAPGSNEYRHLMFGVTNYFNCTEGLKDALIDAGFPILPSHKEPQTQGQQNASE